MDNVEAKIKDLKIFLRKHGVSYDRIEASTQSRLFITEDTYISTRSGYYNKHKEYGLDPLVVEVTKKFLLEISCAYDFENGSIEYEKKRMNALLEKIDKTIGDNEVKVQFVKKSRFGGCTDSRKSIVIYDPPDEPISEYLKIAPGINYHELGHTLFTCSFKSLAGDIEKKLPEYDDEFLGYRRKKKQALVNRVLKTVNALEDGRMENLMGNMYGGAIPYFRSTIFNFLLASIEERVDMGARVTEFDCALIAGRKYIDYEFRRWVFDKYMECDEDHTEEKAKRVNMYINKFITLSWKKDRDEMIDLALGFHYEFVVPEIEKQKEEQQSQKGDDDQSGGGGQGQGDDGEDEIMDDMLQGTGSEMNEMNDDEIDEAEEKMLQKVLNDVFNEERQEDEEDEEDESAPSKGEGDDSDEEGEGEGKGEGGEGEESNEEGQGEGGEDSKDSEASGSKESGNGAGDHDGNEDKDANDPNDKNDDETRKNIAEARKKANEQVEKEAKKLQGKMKGTAINDKINNRYGDKDVTIEMKRQEKALEKKLKEFMRKCRNGYQSRRRKGGVDIGEARRQQYRGGTRIFRQYRHNVQKALDIDVAFVLDCSASMDECHPIEKIEEASRQLWIASTACKSVGARVKIFSFSDYDLGTFEQPDKSKTKYRCPHTVCGTVISDTLYKAESYLNASQANTKWLISLTDGEICDTPTQNQILERMQRDGITCGKINLVGGYYGSYYDEDDDVQYDHVLRMDHDGKENINMLNGDNIVTFFKKIYEESMKRAGIE